MPILKRTFLAIVMLVSIIAVAHAESVSVSPEELKGMTKGKDVFSVNPPEHWTVQTEDASAKGMYAYFIMNGYTYETTPGLIYMRVLDKLGLNVDELLKMDMDNTLKQKDKVKFEPFTVKGLAYAHAARKYVYAKTSCDYVCYIDPGKKELSYLVFVLTADHKHCDEYRDTFTNMLRSFRWGAEK